MSRILTCHGAPHGILFGMERPNTDPKEGGASYRPGDSNMVGVAILAEHVCPSLHATGVRFVQWVTGMLLC